MVKRRKPPADAAAPPADAATFAPVLNAGFQATASRVQEMHAAIAGKTFDNLLRVPGLSLPTRIVQGVHDAVAQGVYAAAPPCRWPGTPNASPPIRHGCRARASRRCAAR